jgi:GxxExxY protein
MLIYEKLTGEIYGAAIEVHRELGPGLLESAYEECLCHELRLKGILFKRQVPLPVAYKGIRLDCGYKMDLVVAEKVVLELKAVEEVTSLHTAQLLTYLRLSGKKVGLLMNFHVERMKDGITRLVL